MSLDPSNPMPGGPQGPQHPCNNCNKPKTVHITEIKAGKKIEKHLCKDCPMVNEGMAAKVHTPLNELLSNFVMAQSGLAKQQHKTCSTCGTTWGKFRQTGLFGCEDDYGLFEEELTPLLKRAHEGATHHVGKVPTRRRGEGPVRRRRVNVNRLRKELARAVEQEDYEAAARLRDQIRTAETSEK